MRLALNDAEQRVQQEVREFLASHALDPTDLPEDLNARVAVLREWQRQLYEAGLVGISWPKEFGGRGGTASEQLVANLEMARAGAPELIGIIALEVVGPSIVAFGTSDQKRGYVRRMLAGEDIWCQGFSEPDAGSDLASLRTRAEDCGDHFLLNGQKTWTSYAQYAKWCAVLARTNPDAPPHEGISYLVVDMESDGVEVRPLIQITGDPEFGEVFFDDVVVPKESLIGELDAGWQIAMHTLGHERGPAVAGRQVKLRNFLDRLTDYARVTTRDGELAIEDPAVRQQLARSYVALEVLRHQTYFSSGQVAARGRLGFESSIDKLWLIAAEQQLGDACSDVLGPHTGASRLSPAGVQPHEFQNVYLYGRAASIYGGSEQIQKNIVAQRILGLPRA
jgi:alkylation response protein AidB-like acyl-CoA dehydrogenase